MKNIFNDVMLYEGTLEDFQSIMLENEIDEYEISVMLDMDIDVVEKFFNGVEIDTISRFDWRMLTMFMGSVMAGYNAGVKDHDKIMEMMH